MSGVFQRSISGLGFALLASSAGACILIERYDPTVPDPKDGGGSGGSVTSTSTTSTSSTSTSTTSTSTSMASGGAGGTGGTGGTTQTGGTGGATSSSSSSSTSASSSGAAGTTLWAKSFGGLLDEGGGDITADGAGNVIVVGSFQSSIDFGGGAMMSAGQNDVFVAKLDGAGNNIWSKGFGDALGQVATSVGTDTAGNVYVAGSFQGTLDFGGMPLVSAGQSDLFLAKLNPGGATVWAKRYGDGAQQSLVGHAIAVAPNGAVVIAGGLNGSIDFGDGPHTSAGAEDIVVAQLDPSGAPVWTRRYGDAADQTVRGIARASNGDIAIVGNMTGGVDFGGGLLDAGTSKDVFVAVLDSAGNHKWSKRFGDATSAQTGRSITFDPAGTVWIAGSFSGVLDVGGGPMTAAGTSDNIFVARLGDNGVHLASKAFGDGSAPGQAVRSIAADSLGNIVIGGDFSGAIDFGLGLVPNAGSLDAFVVELLPSLTPKFAHTYGDGSVQSVSAIAFDHNDNLLVTGVLRGNMNFGTGALTSAGGSDVFVAKLSP